MKFKLISEPFLNCDKIHPLQQENVKSLIDYLSLNPNVKSIKIFGSSITNRCHIDSDLDFYVELDHYEKIINKYFPFVYDYWNNFTVEKVMLDEINDNGVIVYEYK